MKYFKTVILCWAAVLFLFLTFSGCTKRIQEITRPSPAQLQKAAREQITAVRKAVDFYTQEVGTYPEMLEDLLYCPPGYEDVWAGPYLKKSYLRDPWGRPFFYYSSKSNKSYDLISYGADGKPGGEDYDADIGTLNSDGNLAQQSVVQLQKAAKEFESSES